MESMSVPNFRFMSHFPSAEKPHFLVRFQDTMATVGEHLRLDCRLDGIPEPDIIWYKDDQPLQPGEGVSSEGRGSRVLGRGIGGKGEGGKLGLDFI